MLVLDQKYHNELIGVDIGPTMILLMEMNVFHAFLWHILHIFPWGILPLAIHTQNIRMYSNLQNLDAQNLMCQIYPLLSIIT